MPKRFIACAIGLVLLAPSLADPTPKKSTPALPPPGMSLCLKKPEPGPCKAAMQRFYFDADTGTCRTFIWGGCEGSVPFETLKACKETCEAQKD